MPELEWQLAAADRNGTVQAAGQSAHRRRRCVVRDAGLLTYQTLRLRRNQERAQVLALRTRCRRPPRPAGHSRPRWRPRRPSAGALARRRHSPTPQAVAASTRSGGRYPDLAAWRRGRRRRGSASPSMAAGGQTQGSAVRPAIAADAPWMAASASAVAVSVVGDALRVDPSGQVTTGTYSPCLLTYLFQGVIPPIRQGGVTFRGPGI